MSEYQLKTVSVVGFDELMQALDRAERKGYMPGPIQEEWEGFNWMSAPKREWVGLTDDEISEVSYDFTESEGFRQGVYWAQNKLKEKNNGN